MNDQPIDPRYDPAFQRGFTGSVQTGVHPHGVVRSSHTSTRPPEQREASAPAVPASARPLSDAPPSEQAPPSRTAIDEVAPDQLEAVDDDEVVAETEDGVRRLTRNPFLIVLALVGAALAVAGGSWAIAGRATMTSSGSLASERDYWFVQSALLGAPILIALGVAILAGVLFVFANAWNRAR